MAREIEKQEVTGKEERNQQFFVRLSKILLSALEY